MRRLDDFDTWWHLAAGRWIVQHGAVPHTDTLSYTVPTHPWINLQWLYDVALFLLYRVGGADLLVVAATIAFTAAVWLMLRNARLWVGEVTAALLAVWALLVVEERFLIRPEMVSFFLLEAVLYLLMSARRDEGRRLWLLVPVMLVWVNCHSLFIIGLFCIGCTVAGALVAKVPLLPPGWRQASNWEPTAMRRLCGWSAAAALVTLVNPYFAEGVLFPFKLLTRIDGSNDVFQAIGEFRRPFSGYFTTFAISAYQSYFFFVLAVAVLAAAIGFAGSKKGKAVEPGGAGFDLGQAATLAGLTWISLMARRNIGIFAFGVTPIVAAQLGVIGCAAAPALRASARKLADRASPLILAALVALSAMVVTNSYYYLSDVTREFGLGVFETNFPIRAVEFARGAELPPKIYNDLTSGGYLTWEPAVRGGVFIDGRLEVYDSEFFSEYMSAFSNPRAWRQQVDALGVNTVVLFHRWGNRQNLVRFLMGDPAWSLVYYDDVAVIFVRRAGNTAAIERAMAMFPQWRETTDALLSTPVSSWRWPIERVLALDSYAVILGTVGARDDAARVYERLLELPMPALREANVRLRLGYTKAQQGDLEVAKLHLRRAAELDPSDPRIRQLLERLGD